MMTIAMIVRMMIVIQSRHKAALRSQGSHTGMKIMMSMMIMTIMMIMLVMIMMIVIMIRIMMIRLRHKATEGFTLRDLTLKEKKLEYM